ncbi:MAG: hypothetical protein KC646_02765 [Candidatus Cloacimonetes bacterium]|nr:hypothetical protein [Candidatus Cloacimonadota bacterium]
MHPIIKSFVDSIEIDNKSNELLKSIEEIRDKTPVSIFYNEQAHVDAGFLGALDMILGDFIYSNRIEILLFQFSTSETCEFEVAKYLSANIGEYNLVLDSKLNRGAYLIAGAKDLIFGRLGSIKRYFATVKMDGKDIRSEHLSILEEDNKDPLDHLDKKQILVLKASEKEIQNRLKYLTASDHQDRISGLSDLSCGCESSLNRHDLKRIGYDVFSMESLGFLASYSQLSALYQSLASIQTMIEGVKPEDRRPDMPHSNVDFRAKAQVLAVLETPKKRLICFQITEENPSRNTQIFWVEK